MPEVRRFQHLDGDTVQNTSSGGLGNAVIESNNLEKIEPCTVKNSVTRQVRASLRHSQQSPTASTVPFLLEFGAVLLE